MQKAKSRLKTTAKVKLHSPSYHRPSFSKIIQKYRRHWPLLLLSLPFYGGVYYIIMAVHPDQIQHFLIPNTYLPLQLVLFGGNFFFFSYLLLKTRRGLETSLLLSGVLFLKLQLIINYLVVTAGLIILILGIEVLISWSKKSD